VITRSAAAARARARRTPSASISSAASRNPAVSTSVTGTLPSTTRVSKASRVVPGIGETIATSRSANALTSDDLPTFGWPVTAKTRPSRRRSPRRPSSRCAATSPHNAASSTCTCASTSGGRSSSGKSISASCWASSSRSRSAQPPYSVPRAPSSWRNAWRRCASVSAAIRSCTASASVRSIRPLRKARRVNSPGSAGLAPSATSASATPARTARPPCRKNSAESSPV
jgi:hypothetical protein